jgi:hypothetical protein
MFIESGYKNLWGKEDFEKYIDPVWQMLQEAYASQGGFMGAFSPEELIEDSSLWKMVTRDGKPVAVIVYKNRGSGRKGFGYASDGTAYGKKALYGIMGEDLGFLQRDSDYLREHRKEDKEALVQYAKENSKPFLRGRNAYVEVSGPLEHIIKTYYQAQPIPASEVEDILQKKIDSFNEDGYHYTREIAGHPHEKILYGFPVRKGESVTSSYNRFLRGSLEVVGDLFE